MQAYKHWKATAPTASTPSPASYAYAIYSNEWDSHFESRGPRGLKPLGNGAPGDYVGMLFQGFPNDVRCALKHFDLCSEKVKLDSGTVHDDKLEFI